MVDLIPNFVKFFRDFPVFIPEFIAFSKRSCYFLIMGTGKTPKGVKTKSRIIESAIKLMTEKGLKNVTLVEICDKSKVAQGTFYHYFDSINDILYEILRIEGQEIFEYYENLKMETPTEQLTKIINFQLCYYEKKGKEVVANILGNEFIPYGGDSRVENLLPTRAFVSEIISKGQSSGIFSNTNTPEQDAFLLMALILTYSYMWVRDKSETPLKEIANEHLNKVINQIILKNNN